MIYNFYNEKILKIYLRICRLKPSGIPKTFLYIKTSEKNDN